jgi:hypothetical protein
MLKCQIVSLFLTLSNNRIGLEVIFMLYGIGFYNGHDSGVKKNTIGRNTVARCKII